MPDPSSQQQDLDPAIVQKLADVMWLQTAELREQLKAYGYPEVSWEQALLKMLHTQGRERSEKATEGS